MTETYEPRFDIDRPFGEVGESYVRDDLMLAILHNRIEVKRDAQFVKTGNFYIETHQRERCRPDGRWLPSRSGILCTEAKFWALVTGELDVVLFVPTDLLRSWATRPGVAVKTCENSDCPTKGALIPWRSIQAHLRGPVAG